MLCCVSRKASARPNNQGHQKHQKSIDSDCSGSSSGFSESSSASSGDFATSGFSATSSSSSSTSGFSSTSPRSFCASVNSSSSSSGSEFSKRFDVTSNYLENRSRFTPEFTVRGSSFSSSVKNFPPIPPKRLQTFSPLASSLNRSNSGNGDSLLEKEKLAEDEPPVLLPCAICTRTFKPQSLEKHTRICERSAIKKRKPFDSARQRIQGTDLAEFSPKETIKRKVYQEEKPVAAAAFKGWKQTHDEFLRAVRAARGETIDAPPQHQVVAPSHVTVGVPTRPNEKGMCPTCNRQFSIKAYERHVAWCKEHATRVPISPATNVAKERLEARMRYRAPLLKNRRPTNRDKYSAGSAVNLTSYTSKNLLANPRAKESASTPNCNNKGGNEAAMGGGIQSHRKATATARRSGQEGMSSGPMKSRFSDRSSRPSAEIESGPTTNSSSCPIPPRINVHQHSRRTPTRAIPPSYSTSPLPTSRSVSKPESSRIGSQDCETSRRIGETDRRAMQRNVFNEAKHHHRQNIVSARSHGHPKVNDIAINDELIGITVQRCGHHKNDEKEAEEGLVTWKQISEDNNLIKQTKFLRLNNGQDLEETTKKMRLADSEPIVQNELNCSLKSSLDLGTFGTNGIKKLNQTYLIRESLDAKKNLSGIVGRRMRRPVVNSPRTEYCYAVSTPRKKVFRNLGNHVTSPNRFNAEVNVTSSSCEEPCEANFGRAMSHVLSERAKFAPLDLKMIQNDGIADQGDTSRSGGSTVSLIETCRKALTKRTPKLKPMSGRELICENSLNLRILEEANCENLIDSKNSFEGFPDIGLEVDIDGDHRLLDGPQSAGSTAEDNCNRLLRKKTPSMKPISREKFDGEKQLISRSCNEESAGSKYYDQSIEDIEEKVNIEERNPLLDASRSPELKPKSRKELDSDEPFDFRLCNEDDTRRKHCSKSIENFEEIIDTEGENQLSETSRAFKSTATTSKTCRESLTKEISKMRFVGEKVLASDGKASESFDEDKYLTSITSWRSFQDLKINYDEILETLDTPRSAKSAANAIKSCSRSSRKEISKLLVGSCDVSLKNNSCSEENYDSSINSGCTCSVVEVSEKEIKNKYAENGLSCCVEKSFDRPVENIEQSLVEPVDLLANSIESEKGKKTTMDQPNNYQRCGTYVIDRATNRHVSTTHPASDESLEEKPLLKRRRTELDIANNQIEKSSISNEAPEENASKDLNAENNVTNFQNCPSIYFVKSAEELESTESKIEPIDRSFYEVDEKYVNRNFDYDSDNTGGDNNLDTDDDPEASMTTQGKLSFGNEISSYDLHPKALSDSIVPRRLSSAICSLKSQKECDVQDSSEIKRKLKTKMSLLRGSTDTLISSVEASGEIITEKSWSIVVSCEIDKTPQVEEETIRELDFQTIGMSAALKTSCCGFLPEIPVDRITGKNGDRKEKKIAPLDGIFYWEKARKNSRTRLINLDPPKCHETRVKNTKQSNVGNRTPAVSISFRKERLRGSCKDYDPFLLAERQMNELLSDTCSDQSFTDSPANRRRSLSPSAPNYPLSHSSAFVKYPDPVPRKLNDPDKRASLIAPPSEFDDIAADFSSDSTETNSISHEILANPEDSRARENGFGHESKRKDSRDHVLGRRVIIDKSKALGTNEMVQDSGRKNSQTNEKARKILDKVTPKVVRPHVTRSSSVRATSAPKAPERKNNNNSSITATKKINSNLNNRNNNYASLSGSNMSLSSIVSSEVEVKRSNSLLDELASSFEDDASGTYPSLRSLLKNNSLSVTSPVQSNRPRNGQISDEELSSPDSYQRQDHSKLSADSAYSSLNRKYSNHGRSTNDVGGRLEEDSPQRRRDSDAGSTSSAKSKLSKFCHECGCKFPETAKFCCECGIRRLAL